MVPATSDVALRARKGAVRLVVLDGNGKEHARRDVNEYEYPSLGPLPTQAVTIMMS